jgi:hypothetical protein
VVSLQTAPPPPRDQDAEASGPRYFVLLHFIFAHRGSEDKGKQDYTTYLRTRPQYGALNVSVCQLLQRHSLLNNNGLLMCGTAMLREYAEMEREA